MSDPSPTPDPLDDVPCYCEEGDTYCGTCQVCDAPGHVRAHPGGAPVTGAWCDEHYREIMVSRPRIHPLHLAVWLLMFVPVAWVLWRLIAAL